MSKCIHLWRVWFEGSQEIQQCKKCSKRVVMSNLSSPDPVFYQPFSGQGSIHWDNSSEGTDKPQWNEENTLI